jgi:ankyrin repeat protein
MDAQEKSFIEACFEGNLRSIKTTIKYGVNIHVENDWCIDIVARKNYPKIVTFLLDNGITHESAAKNIVLAYTCEHGNYKLAKLLIDSSDAYKKDHMAIQWAAAKGNLKLVELLLGYMDDFNGLFCRTASTGQNEVIQFLIDNEIQNHDDGASRAVSENNTCEKNRAKGKSARGGL